MINVLQLCSGRGSRFKNSHAFPKPFIPVNGLEMYLFSMESLVKSIPTEYRMHHLFQQEHVSRYPIHVPQDSIVHTIDHYTNGAASSAHHVISTSTFKNEPWLIVDCDFYIEYDPESFQSAITQHQHFMFTTERDNDVSCSYSCVDDLGKVLGVAEKQPISRIANTGHYYWGSGTSFCESYLFYASNNIRFGEEMYVAPLYNHPIQKGDSVGHLPVTKFLSLGTPDNLSTFNERYGNIRTSTGHN